MTGLKKKKINFVLMFRDMDLPLIKVKNFIFWGNFQVGHDPNDYLQSKQILFPQNRIQDFE